MAILRSIEPLSFEIEQEVAAPSSISLLGIPGIVLRWSLGIVGLLALLHVLTTDLVVIDIFSVDGSFDLEALRNLFKFQREASLSTWFSIILLMSCAVTLLLIGTQGKRKTGTSRVAWLSLGLIFVALSIDEQIGFHEVMNNYVSEGLETGGALHFGWVIPGAGFAALAGLLFWRFFKSLPRPYPVLFFGAGAIFLAGALGFEIHEALVVSQEDRSRYELGLSFLIQDALEMIGASIFLYALLRYGVEHLGWRRLSINA